MVSLMNINYGFKELICRCQNCDAMQILIFDGYLKMRESLYTWKFIWVNTILNHIDTSTIKTKNILKHSYPIGMVKCLILNINTWVL